MRFAIPQSGSFWGRTCQGLLCNRLKNCILSMNIKSIMKIKLYRAVASIILLFTFCSNFAQQKTTFNFNKNENLNVELFGKVNQLRIKTKDLKNNVSDSIVYDFDNNGNPVSIISFGLGVDIVERNLKTEEIHYEFKNGKLIFKLNKINDDLDGEIYEYDKNWNVILEKNYLRNILIKEIVSEYDLKNRIVKSTEYLYGGFSNYNEKTQEGKANYIYQIDEFQYDDSNNLVMKTSQNLKNHFTEKRIYKYDRNNNKIEEGQCFLSDIKGGCSNYKPLFGYEYNSKNKLVKQFQLAKFSPHNTDEYHLYDNYGNEIESKGYYIYPDKFPILGYHFKYEYNEFGKKIKDVEVVGEYRSLVFERYKTEITKYDKYQNVVLEEYLKESGLPIKIVVKNYEYDKNGNWTRREIKEGKSYNDITSIEISTRGIIYY